jgi:hypothetical protein
MAGFSFSGAMAGLGGGSAFVQRAVAQIGNSKGFLHIFLLLVQNQCKVFIPASTPPRAAVSITVSNHLIAIPYNRFRSRCH